MNTYVHNVLRHHVISFILQSAILIAISMLRRRRVLIGTARRTAPFHAALGGDTLVAACALFGAPLRWRLQH